MILRKSVIFIVILHQVNIADFVLYYKAKSPYLLTVSTFILQTGKISFFVCLFELNRLRNYWIDLKKSFTIEILHYTS